MLNKTFILQNTDIPTSLVAEYIGCSKRIVWYHRNKMGVGNHTWTDADDEELMRMCNDGHKTNDMAKHFRVKERSITVRLGLLRKKGCEVQRATDKRK